MIRTIRQHMYGLVLMPLALLAVTLLVLNGFARVDQARTELLNGQRMVVDLLQAGAVEALVIGNVLAFDEVVEGLLRNSSFIACIVLEDAEGRIISRQGQCAETIASSDRFALQSRGEGLSDFEATAAANLGHIAISMNEMPVRQKRTQIVIQLIISLLFIALVLALMQRFLKRRLIEPIEQIHVGMEALREGAYHTRIPICGDDELARLGHSINATIERIASYTRELERRRDDASRALQEADDEGLARDALVRWLTEDLEGPLHAMQGELTAVAVANNDPSLKAGIRRALALLQDARASLSELMQVAATHRHRTAPPCSLNDLWLDLQQDIHKHTGSNDVRVALTLAGKEVVDDFPMSGISVDVDSVRLRKALLYLIGAMGRNSQDRRLQVNAQFVPVAEDQLHVVFTIKGGYGPAEDSPEAAWVERVSGRGLGRTPPVQLRWTDRDTRVVDYLLRSLGIAPTYTVSDSGGVSVVVELTCGFGRGGLASGPNEPHVSGHGSIVVGIVTDDPELKRLTARGDIARVEFRMITLAQALADISTLSVNTVLLIDVSGDIADAFTLIHRLRLQPTASPPLIAVCPSGRISAQLEGKLLDAGFSGIVQKPLQYSRVIEVIESAPGMANRTRSIEFLGR